MLQVTTEIGKPGMKERERRHFPDIQNKKSIQKYYSHGRRYIPHGYGVYEEWRPHPHNIQVDYSENGPDWKSRLKYIPDPQNPRYPAAEIFENNWHAMRPYPWTYARTDKEWLLDPGLSNAGMKCTFNGEHMATRMSNNELSHEILFGRGRNDSGMKSSFDGEHLASRISQNFLNPDMFERRRSEEVIDKRNGIPEAAPGDKQYQIPEYSSKFHHGGSSRPIVEFGFRMDDGEHNQPWNKDSKTFVALQPLPVSPREPFRQQQRRREKVDEIRMVKSLTEWRPATPLKAEKVDEKK